MGVRRFDPALKIWEVGVLGAVGASGYEFKLERFS